jgi:hypothetical protein
MLIERMTMNFFGPFSLIVLMASAAASETPMQIVTAPFGPMAQLGAGAINVPCAFDSHSETCLLDTGSDKSNIQYDSYSQTYSAIGTTTGEGLSGDPVTCDLIKVGQFEIGGTVADNQQFARCAPLSGQASQNIAEGNIAGLTVLVSKTLRLDFTTSQFSLSDSIPPGLDSMPLVIHQKLGHFGFSTRLSGVTADSIVDTGAALTTVDQKFIQANSTAFQFVQSISGGQDVNGNPVTMNLYLVSSISLGKTSLSHVYVLGADFTVISQFLPEVPVILGFNVISQKNWYFDLDHKTWAVY